MHTDQDLSADESFLSFRATSKGKPIKQVKLQTGRLMITRPEESRLALQDGAEGFPFCAWGRMTEPTGLADCVVPLSSLFSSIMISFASFP